MIRHYIKINILCCILALAGLPIFFTSGCATGGDRKERTYKQNSVKTFSSIEAAKAAEQIDRYAASMIFFKLDKDVDAFSVGITAEYTIEITGIKKIKKVYFIVEKIIDMSNLKVRANKYHYAELGRNFDHDWNREKEITLVSSKSEPFKNLDGNSLYRIRFTTFSQENVDFAVTVKADCAVTFMDDIR